MVTDGIKLVKFYAPWCRPCNIYSPKFELFVEKYNIEHESINIDEDRTRAQELGITSIPATVLYVDGEVTKTVVGVQQSKDLHELVSGARA